MLGKDLTIGQTVLVLVVRIRFSFQLMQLAQKLRSGCDDGRDTGS